MKKALLMSILAATIVIPLFAAGTGRSLKSAVRRSLIATAVFCVLYWLALLLVYPALAPSKRDNSTSAPH